MTEVEERVMEDVEEEEEEWGSEEDEAALLHEFGDETGGKPESVL